MSYGGRGGELSAIYRDVSLVPGIRGPDSSMQFVAPGSVTRRQFGLFRRDMNPHSGGPGAHFHRTFSESFYVIEGTVRLYDGKGWVEGNAGDFLYVPKGGIHAFRNDGDKPASMLIIFTPGTARERYFIEMNEIRKSGRRLSPAEETKLLARHDQYMVK